MDAGSVKKCRDEICLLSDVESLISFTCRTSSLGLDNLMTNVDSTSVKALLSAVSYFLTNALCVFTNLLDLTFR